MSQNPERNRCQPEVLQIDSQCRQDYQEQERMAERPSLFSRSEGQKSQGLVARMNGPEENQVIWGIAMGSPGRLDIEQW
jgi:hypothetical protein